MREFWEGVVTVALAIVSLAMLAVAVSRKSQTPQVIQAASSGFVNSLGVAEAPVTGVNYTINSQYPNSGLVMGNSSLGYFGSM